MDRRPWTADELELAQLNYEIATEGYDVPRWAVLGSAKRERWIRAAVAVAHRDRAHRAGAKTGVDPVADEYVVWP